jgi:ribosomal-protein-alanine N-acetyltransferase
VTGPNESPDALAGTLVIEPATRDDLDCLVRLEQASFTAPWTRKMFEAELDGNPFSRLLVARPHPGRGDASDAVGYACFWVVFEELRIMNLAVAPAARRHGIARALIRRALAQGLAGGATRAVLEVRASNVAAVRLYEAEGFTAYAVRAAYYRDPIEDALLMSLEPLDRSRVGSGPRGGPAGKLALAVGDPEGGKIA